MQKKTYQKTLLATTRCVMRGVDATKDDTLIPMDMTRPSVNYETCIEIQKAVDCGILLIRAVHTRGRKSFLENTKKDFPGTTWSTLIAHSERSGIDLV